MSQRTRVLRVIALATLPLLAFAVFILWRDQSRGRERIKQDRAALARAAAFATEAFIEGNLSSVRTLSVAPLLTDLPLEADRSAALARVLAENPDWQGLSVLDEAGWNVTTSGDTPPHTVNVADRPYFQAVLATDRPVVGSAIIGRVTGQVTVVLAAPVHFASGERGVLVAPLSTLQLAESLRTRIASDQVEVVVVDSDGQTFVAADPARVQVLESLRGRPDADAALAGDAGTRVLAIRDVDTLVAYAPVSELGWAVIVAEPVRTAFAPARTAFRIGLAVLLAAVAIVAGSSWYFSGRLALAYDGLFRSRQDADAARADAERERRRALFVADVSRELAGSLDYATTLAAVARLCVPALADWCTLDLVDGDHIERMAVAHADPERAEAAEELARLYAPLRDADTGPGRAIALGEPTQLTHVGDDTLIAVARDPEHLRLLRTLGLRSALSVPLKARGRTLGAISLVSAQSPDAFGPDEVRIANDIATRAALAVDNARLYGELAQELGTRDEFLASAAHDLRTPLTAIKGAAQLLLRQRARGLDDSPGRLDRGLRTIESTSTRMAGMIDSLLDVAHLQLGRALELDRRPMDLVALARAAAEEAGQVSTLHHIKIEGDDAVFGFWDADRLQRAIGNLLDNAVKFSPDGGEVRVVVRSVNDGERDEAVLSVRDNGVGIPRGDLARVFQRFRRGSNVVGRIGGTGLGLTGAQQLVELHGGTIAVASAEGAGTTVTVRLPREQREGG